MRANINGVLMSMELDTGAVVSVIGEHTVIASSGPASWHHYL